MKTITVIVNVERRSSDFRDARLAFWDAFARESDQSSNARENLEEYAAELEQRVKTALPRALHQVMSNALLSYESRGELPRRRGLQVAPGRLIMMVEEIRYGSMKVDLGIPDLDAFVELLGNNSEVFEAVLGAYIPEAFDRCLPGNTRSLEFEISIPSEVQNYINSSKLGKVAKGEGSTKEKGTAILVSLIRSPLILPIILICFLWYYARQDMVEDRRVTYGLIQTLVAEQTAVIGLLKDKQVEPTKDHTAPEHGPADTGVKSTPKANKEK